MRPRDTAPVGRRPSALGVLGAVACLALSPGARAQQPAKPPPPTQPAGVPKAPADPPTPPEAPPAKPGAVPPPKAPGEAPAPKPPAAAPTSPADAKAPAVSPEREPAPEQPEEKPLPPPPPAPKAPPTSPAGVGAVPLWPEPAADAAALESQGGARPKPKKSETSPDDRVYAEDWWSHARPVFEIHGYFRLRTQLFHRFSLGRLDAPGAEMWPRPTDDSYVDYNNIERNTRADLCTDEEAELGPNDSATSANNACDKATQGGANIRFRVSPELHISDNLRILSQIDLLDNLVLGSTPGGYNNQPSANGGYEVVPRGGYAPLGFYEDTQVPPASGRNALRDSIAVKRAWAEYASPVGEIRFGRMPFHWGLGMMFNAGDGHDDDYQSTVDRIQAVTSIKPLDLYFSAAWDFPNEGISSDAVALPNPEPYDLSQLDDVDQYVLAVARKKSPELERLSLSRGEFVFNGGFQFVYRQQTIADDRSGTGPNDYCEDSAAIGCMLGSSGNQDLMQYVRRDAYAVIPDLWLEARYKKFRFALEAATVQGAIANTSTFNRQPDAEDEYTISAWGLATELEQRLVEDKLLLGFKFGWASGDADEDGLVPFGDPAAAQNGDRTFETFRFHPSYRVDLILNRNVLTRVQGSYYFRPNVDYDFIRDPNGQRIGGGIAAIWTRASQFIQAPGHDRDLGIELNGRVYYQAKDGALNDVPGLLGGFYTELDYGVFFPMAGVGYPPGTVARIVQAHGGREDAADTRIAQTLRWYIGVVY